MNTYLAFYRGRKIEILAETSRSAQILASTQFKAKKSYEISVVLVEKAGQPVIHAPQDLVP